MTLFSISVVKNLLKKYEVRPLKKFGQNFLIDKAVIKKIITAADINPNDVVLEIGPGIGAITQEIAKKAKKVIAVEKDRKMVEILKETLKDFKNTEVVQEDILSWGDSVSPNSVRPSLVIGNLPYYLTSPVIRKFLEIENPLKTMVLMVQREVAQRICAKPPKMNLLAVSAQFYANVKIISPVSRKSSWPSPKVNSAIIKITPLITADRRSIDTDSFFRIVKAGFSQPRKQLINNLQQLEIDREEIKNWLIQNKIQPSQRPATLSINNWLNLTKTFKQ